jgi:hypothetical protein
MATHDGSVEFSVGVGGYLHIEADLDTTVSIVGYRPDGTEVRCGDHWSVTPDERLAVWLGGSNLTFIATPSQPEVFFAVDACGWIRPKSGLDG